MADHEEGAARAQGVHGVPQCGPALGGGELQVEDADQVEGARGRRPAGHVALDPLDLDPVRCGQVPRDAERHAREIHARHAPPTLGQPHRIASGATREIERRARSQAGDLGDEEAVGDRRAMDAIRGGVAAVPALPCAVGAAGPGRLV